MFKNFLKAVFVFLMVSVSNAFATVHTELPTVAEQAPIDLAYYEHKEIRCMDAFARSDFDVAYVICTPLANLGFKDAQLITGLLYAYGEGVDKDMHRAKQWLIEALKNGRMDAADALRAFDLD